MATGKTHNGWGTTAAERSTITHEQSLRIIQSAVAHATKIAVPQNIAVVDPTGLLMGFLHMDNSYLGSIDIAMKKARTCVLFNGIKNEDLFQASQPGGPLWGIQETNGGLVTFGGGLAIYHEGKMIGGIGVSGGSVQQDIEVAQAGIDGLTKS